MLARVVADPYIPEQWDRNGSGMQGHGLIEGNEAERCVAVWLAARDAAVDYTRRLLAHGVHKQTTNRLLEPFMWHTVIVTATEWSNFYNLRCNPLAHPALRNTAEAMRDAQAASTPNPIEHGEWHLPYFDPERDADIAPGDRPKVCAARCARVSYLTHDGNRDLGKDVVLADSLLANGHMAPLEHVARPMTREDMWKEVEVSFGLDGQYAYLDSHEHFAGNFRGWVQLRKTIAGEADILAHRSGS
jgi:hypothetical protein